MGSDCHVHVVGGRDGLVDAAVARIEDLEARWSRFRPTSELSLLNGLPDRPVVVSPETFELITKAAFAWKATGGAFDPTVLPALVALGYDRSFAVGVLDSDEAPGVYPGTPGCASIATDAADCSITLTRGVTLDPGGIGKGLAGDIVVREILAAGAAGVMVDLGGDVRVAGAPPDGNAWTIGIADPARPGRDLRLVRLADGAVATSSTAIRSWRRGSERVHHLVDPSTGRSLGDDVMSVTVVAGEGWWAEVSTKHALGLGPDRAATGLVNAVALFASTSGTVSTTPGFAAVAA